MAETTTNDVVWLTQEALDKLKAEYQHLTTEGRAAVTAKIASAREEGDLSENGGYHAAREEQGQMEARILQLKAKIEKAQVGEPADDGIVEPGMEVTIAFDNDPADTETFLFGSREVMGLDDNVDTAVYSPQSPLGQAINGKRKGDKVSYQAPNGKPIYVMIMEAKPYTG